MTYRNVLKTSQDFYESLEKSRHIADKLTETLRKNGNPNAYVRSYSYPDVFYEQYLTMWNDTLTSLGLSIFAIFVVMFLFLGLDFYSASVITFTIVMIIVNLMGLMYWWDISLNAVSLVNLVVVSHTMVTFISPTHTNTFCTNRVSFSPTPNCVHFFSFSLFIFTRISCLKKFFLVSLNTPVLLLFRRQLPYFHVVFNPP